MLTSVVSPALTFFPSKANFAFRRKVSNRPTGPVKASPLSFWIFTSVITSTFLVVSACTLPADTTKNTVNIEINNDSTKLVFTNFFIMAPFSF